MIKYEHEILEAYKAIGFSPRGNQVKDIDTVIRAFLDDGFQTVVLSAPTGTGKSIIGAVVSEVIHKIKNPDRFEGASFLLSPTNLLSEQYYQTFQADRDLMDNTFRMLKGANNYECSALCSPSEYVTAEFCALRLFHKEKEFATIEKHCDGCTFNFIKKKRETSRHLITNYSWYFVDRMYLQQAAKRTICVFDEAHLLNDLFTEHNAIYFSDSRLDKMISELGENIPLADVSLIKGLKKIKADLVDKKIDHSNYVNYLTTLADIYSAVTEICQDLADRSSNVQSKYITYSKLAKKYFGLGCKISDFIIYGYEHAFEFKEKDPKKQQSENEVSVKPIFVGSMFSTLINSEYNLLMSATISKTFAERTLDLPNATHIKLDPTFSPENKKVVFYKPQSLNYNSLKDSSVLSKLSGSCKEIVKHHIQKGESGIVLAPSFVLAEHVSKDIAKSGAKVILHGRGEKLADVVKYFKAEKKPSVLITPSGFEGLDLSDDLSRFQIILKAPYGSLGDSRMHIILNKYPDIYKLLCLMKLIQGAGRSVRSPTDYAVTYMLDSNIQNLWNGNLNAWKDEFSNSFSTILT